MNRNFGLVSALVMALGANQLASATHPRADAHWASAVGVQQIKANPHFGERKHSRRQRKADQKRGAA